MESKYLTEMINHMHMEEFIQWFEDNHMDYTLIKTEDYNKLEDELEAAIECIENSGVDWEEINNAL